MKTSEAQTENNIETIISPVFSNLLSQKPNGSKESKKEEEKEEKEKKNRRKKGYLFLIIFLLLLGAAAYYILRDGGITGRVVGVINTTNETPNTTPSLPQECQGYDTLENVNSQLSSTGAFIKNISYSDGVCNVFIQLDGITEIRVLTPDITGLSARTFDIQEDRLSTKMVKLTGSFNYANVSAVKLTEELTLYLLECVEFKGEECNRWRLIDGTPRNKVQALQNYLEYTVYGPGVYSTSKLKPGARKFIPSENVYINTNCEKCLDKTNCAADNFCPIQDVGIDQYDYSAQLNFDLYTLTRNVEDAEICMYNYYTSGEPSTLYFKYAPESFCSDITGANIASNFITYQVVNNTYQAVKNKGEWVCTNVNSLIKEAQFNKLTNLFVNVLGEDVNGGNKPFNCFTGISNLSKCGGTNPSGASDCRPYLLINDEWIR